MAENKANLNVSSTNQNDISKISFRDIIAIGMICLSVGLLIVLSIISLNIIHTKGQPANFEDIQKLFGMLLPLLGTWVGTVLAYYFSKDNFIAANQSVHDLVKQITSTDEKLHEIKVSDVMLKPENFTYKTVDNRDIFEKSEIQIQELIKLMIDSNSERLPIFEKDSLKFVFLFYRSTLERFQIGCRNGDIKLTDTKKTVKEDDLTVKNMFESTYKLMQDIRELTKKKVFLTVNSTLEEVRALMSDNTLCQDVFITKSGNKDEKVEGWVKDSTVIEKAELFRKAGAKY
jgi:hypothetical protein